MYYIWIAISARLQRVIGNLLDNAIKFSHPSGSIAVSVSVDNNHVVIEVRDQGHRHI